VADDPFDPVPEIPRGVIVSRDLDVSGRSTVVSTVDLDVAADQLEGLGHQAALLSGRLRALERRAGGASHAHQALIDIEVAIRSLDEVADQAGFIGSALRTVARGYVFTDRLVEAGVRAVTIQAANWLGDRLPVILLQFGPLVPVAAITIWLGLRALTDSSERLFAPSSGPKVSAPARSGDDPLNNPTSVDAIRQATSLIGPLILGATGLPAIPGTGRYMFELGVRSLTGVGKSGGMFDETPVKLAATRELPLEPTPTTYSDRLARIPNYDDAGPQVVIEKYVMPGEPPRYEVYVGGTVTFNPLATTEPWDMTSNMMNAAGIESGSVAAVRAAMAAAGVDQDSPVQFAGYSQGGGVAARLAASGDYNTKGLVTFAGPTGQVPLPDTFPAVLVEHPDDLVPALGGPQDNRGAVLVRRDVFEGDALPDMAVPAHHREYYVQTAGLMDSSRSPQLDSTLAALNRFTEGGTLESRTGYILERVAQTD
jgi:hypothetical protein